MFKSVCLMTGVLLIAACAPVAATTAPQDGPVIVDRHGNGARQCVLEDWQSWTGKPRSTLPAAPEGMVFRVLCKECAATMDYRSNRVTFTYGDDDVITRVTCG